jgi:hypothetical protein
MDIKTILSLGVVHVYVPITSATNPQSFDSSSERFVRLAAARFDQSEGFRIIGQRMC